MKDLLLHVLTESWLVLGQMSPYLLFGFLAAGILSVCLSPDWIERHLGRGGFGPVLKASLFGVPLPLCSCGVIPVAASMRRHGASRAATTAFLLSTPQTGVDSIAVTYALLGPVFALFRPLAALATGLIGGSVSRIMVPADGDEGCDGPSPSPCTAACCAHEPRQGVLLRILRYGFITLPRDIGPALLVGVLVAGAMAALLPQGQLKMYIGGGVMSILLLMAAGVPLYVCATASVPLAAGFMHLGASPGAALAFLIAGPATNAATITTIWKVLGRRSTIIYVATVAASAIAFGLLLNGLLPALNAGLPQWTGAAHAEAGSSWIHHGAAVLLLAVLVLSYARSSADGSSAPPSSEECARQDLAEHKDAIPGNRLELVVTGMTCAHCAQSVRDALRACTGVASAQVDVATGRAVIVGDALRPEQLITAILGAGYEAREPTR